jgi:cytochrome c-type biogenesis protein CcmH
MSFWQVALILSGFAACFILWPLASWRPRKSKDSIEQARIAENRRLYQEHLAELEQALENDEISQEEFAALKLEQQRALLQDTDLGSSSETSYRRDGAPLIVAFALLVPVLGWLAYLQLGAKADWEIHEAATALRAGDQQGQEFETELRHDLARRLEERPKNSQNWYLLANLAMNAQDYDQAVEALRRITELEPESAQITAELAQALFLQAGNRVTPEVRERTKRALELEPRMPTALGLAGIDAFQQGYFQQAIDYWSRAVDVVGEGAPGAKALLSGIARAQAELKALGKVPEKPGEAGNEPALLVTVELGDKVAVDPSSTVFVYARAFQGPPMPLAIQRLNVGDLPQTVRLTEAMAMAPGMSLSKFDKLEVVARVSKSGNAVPQSGDWQAVQGPVELAEEPVKVELTIDQQIP